MLFAPNVHNDVRLVKKNISLTINQNPFNFITAVLRNICFLSKYRLMNVRKANRLKDYDYSQNGFYFVTICTKNRKEYFGKINDGEMVLNDYGEIANQLWLEIPDHFEDIILDESVIMPNHLHGIIIIDSDEEPVGNRHACSLQEGRQYQKLPVVMGSYKSAVTREINQIHNEFNWQKSFYDHIIRNDKSLHRIRKQIHYNPLKWDYDQENQNEIPLKQKKEFWKIFLKDI